MTFSTPELSPIFDFRLRRQAHEGTLLAVSIELLFGFEDESAVFRVVGTGEFEFKAGDFFC